MIRTEINNYIIAIGRYNYITPYFGDDREINNYVIMRYYYNRIKMESIDLEDDDYLTIHTYLFNDGDSRVINNLIADKFTNISIKLAINLIKNK